MNRHLCAIASLALLFLASPLRAANGPHVGADRQRPLVWTNDAYDPDPTWHPAD